MRWTKAKTNFVVDAAIMLAMLGEAITGFVLWVILPSGGYQGGRGLDTASTFVFQRHQWRDMHNWLAITIVAGILLHVVLHWNWIVCMARKMWREAFPKKQQPVLAQEKCEL